LRRHGGTWVIETREDGGRAVLELRETEVFRWYSALYDARFVTTGAPPTAQGAIELRVVTDSTQELRLRCGEADADGMRSCRRDDEAPLLVRIAADPAFVAETFAERQLVQLDPGEVRAIEIAGRDVVRQSVHLDLGVWRLDAPLHPEGDAALDELALEDLLASVGATRAQAWADAPQVDPDRVIRLERASMRGQGGDVELSIWAGRADCLVRVGEGRTARVGEGTCRALGRDLLVDAPLGRVIDDARALVLREGDDEIRLQRADERWVREDGSASARVGERFAEWSQWRTTALRPGDPRGTPAATLEVQPRTGEPYTLAIGDGWARIVGQPWFYLLALAPEEDEPVDEEPIDGAPLDEELPEDGTPPGSDAQ
jgi:hypothetical protein